MPRNTLPSQWRKRRFSSENARISRETDSKRKRRLVTSREYLLRLKQITQTSRKEKFPKRNGRLVRFSRGNRKSPRESPEITNGLIDSS